MNQGLYDYIVKDKAHQAFRRTLETDLAAKYAAQGLSYRERMTRRFELLCAEETPELLPGERICFTRTVRNLPDVLTEDEWAHYEGFKHELGYMSNVCANYGKVLEKGLSALYPQADIFMLVSIILLPQILFAFLFYGVNSIYEKIVSLVKRCESYRFYIIFLFK